MPAISKPLAPQTVMLPPRKGEIAAESDVLIVGGGPAGIGAALGAAMAGAKVVLAERYGFLGGNATAALVMPLMSFHTQVKAARGNKALNLMPSDHGPGDPVISGVLKMFLERLVAAGGAVPPSEQTGYVVPFDPEIFKLVALDLLNEAGVHFLFHAFASATVGQPAVEGVVFETKSGPVVLKAKVIVDCTGDGDVAALAGARFEIGRDDDALVQPMTLMFRMVNFDQEAFQNYIRSHPDQWRGVHGLWDLVEKATSAGVLDLPREDVLFFGTPHEDEVSVNSTRINKVLGIDVWDLSYAEWTSRQQMRQIANFLQQYVPGFEKSYVAQSGINVGVRETRRIVGDYQLTANDVVNAKKFPDAIARCTYPIDIHDPQGKGTLLQRLPAGEWYDIPYRCLAPQGLDQILVAGRCISGTHEAHSSYRVMPVAMATGQAAGVASALAVRNNKIPRDMPFPAIQQELNKQGANLL